LQLLLIPTARLRGRQDECSYSWWLCGKDIHAIGKAMPPGVKRYVVFSDSVGNKVISLMLNFMPSIKVSRIYKKILHLKQSIAKA
jgi:hypothetical protein